MRLALLSLLVLPPCLAIAADPHPITVDDLWAVKRPGALSLSPDSKWVVVEVGSYDLKENESASDLWILAADGSSQRQLTTHKAKDSGPVWSPDGQWIAFTSKRDGDDQPQIYLISPKGGEARRLTKLATGASAIRWFADSTHVACLSAVWPELATDELQAKRLKERAEAKVKAFTIEATSYRYWDHWLSDGRVTHVFSANLESGATKDLMSGWTNGVRALEVGANLYDLAPDGREFAFVADLGPDPGAKPNDDIVTWSVTDGTWKNLTADNPAHDTDPRYSPDGKSLAWLRRVKPRFYAERARIAVTDRSSHARRILTDDWDRSPGSLTWTADSSRLVFTADGHARNRLWSLAPSGGTPLLLVPDNVNSFDVGRDAGFLVYTATTMSSPPRVFAGKPAAAGGGPAAAPIPIESFNLALTSTWKLGTVSETNVAGWHGEPVHTWIVYPPGFDRTKKWPLLQMVHGGPHGAWHDEFHFRWNPQVFAAPGYVVVGVNFHGSTGWGQSFVESSLGQYGEKEFADVEAATDAMLATGYIDSDRLVAAGGSFGGYMMAVMNGRTNRYRAHVCHAGVFNWESMLASDFPGTLDEGLGVFPWDDRERFLKQSAHLLAKNYATPTLVVHGELDYRVPVSQGFEYYNTLRVRGVPARMLYFPDENHWVLKPQNSQLWHREFFAWLARYAPGGGK